MRRLFLFSLALLTAVGCRSLDTNPADPVWVAQTFSGGVQCEDTDYTPPDTRVLLEQADVRVLDTAVEDLAVTAVCGASAYAAVHYALVDAEDVDAALGLGFEQSDAPPEWARD